MSQDVKRYIPDNTPIYLVGESSSEPSTTCIVLTRDHDRIVAEQAALNFNSTTPPVRLGQGLR